MTLNHVRRGSGEPLLLIHGLGGHWQSWETILDRLAAEREVVAVDLPGFGATPPLPGEPTFKALTDAVEAFLGAEGLRGVDAVGTSMGARMVLELARRKAVSRVVALDPGGFWNGPERVFFGATVGASIPLLRALRDRLPAILATAAGRSALLAQFSAHPARLPADVVTKELQAFGDAPSAVPVLKSLVTGPGQEGMPASAQAGSILIVWGRQDRVCAPWQARRAINRFPGAELVWLDDCGHVPHWDQPDETLRLILAHTGAEA